MSDTLTYQQIAEEALLTVRWAGQEWGVGGHSPGLHPYLPPALTENGLRAACRAGQVTRVEDPRVEVAAQALYAAPPRGEVSWADVSDKAYWRDLARAALAALDNMEQTQ